MRVNEVMSQTVTTISVSDSAHTAVARMVARKIRHLPVVDARGTLVGVLTDRDLRHYLFGPAVFKRIGSHTETDLLRRVVTAGSPECAEIVVPFP